MVRKMVGTVSPVTMDSNQYNSLVKSIKVVMDKEDTDASGLEVNLNNSYLGKIEVTIKGINSISSNCMKDLSKAWEKNLPNNLLKSANVQTMKNKPIIRLCGEKHHHQRWFSVWRMAEGLFVCILLLAILLFQHKSPVSWPIFNFTQTESIKIAE